MTTHVSALLQELSRLESPKPLLRLRRRGCGCLLASVYRLPSGDLLLGKRRALVLVHLSPVKKKAAQQVVAWDVAEPPADFALDELGCRHGIPALDVAALRSALHGVSRHGAVHLL